MDRIRVLVFALSLLFPVCVFAQKSQVELSPVLLNKSADWRNDSIHLSSFIIDSKASLPSFTGNRSFSVIAKGWGIYLVKATPFDILQWSRSVRGQIYIDEQIKPKTEAGVINYDMSINRVTTLWSRFPEIDGQGEVLSVKENRPDTSDLDLLGKLRPSAVASPEQENHATIMATIAVGSGNSSFKGKGVAYKAAYSPSDFIDVLPDTPTYYKSGAIHVQNHSYGTGIQNFYGVNARAFDLSTNIDSTLLHVFSAGNSGTSTSGQGIYANVQGMANITGNMKMAKNILLAGAMLEDGTVPGYSSEGPLYDGRIAPHVVAMGDDGTSGSAAIVSGTAILAQQQFRKLYGKPAPASLIKAAMINSASDLGTEGPDYNSGYGALDANATLSAIAGNRFFISGVGSSSSVDFEIDVPSGSRSLKVTLCWNDTAAVSGATKALINDLDLVIINKQTGEVFLPWSLSIFPLTDSLRKPAQRMRDSLNTVEQVSISLPSAATYIVRVSAKVLTRPSMPFSVTYQVEEDGSFKWDFPMKGDRLVSGESTRLRWTSLLSALRGNLEMSKDNGRNWQLIASDISLASGQYPLRLEDSIRQVRFRISAGGVSYDSDDVMVSPSLFTQFGYVCDTALLAYWPKVKGATAYHVYRIQGDTMTRIGTVSDTLFSTAPAGSPYFSVAPVLNGEEAVRGYAVSHRNQNTGCYINGFFVGPSGVDKAGIVLSLGTLFGIRSVRIIKRSDNDRVIFETQSPNDREISTVDGSLHQGINIYRAVITLDNGSTVQSAEESLYYLNNKSHIIFPNPGVQGSGIQLLTENVDDEQGEIFDMQGRSMVRFLISEKIMKLPTERLSKGVYSLRISKEGRSVQLLPFVIY